MIIIGDSETYKIGDIDKTIHLPRIYISDLKIVRFTLELLQKNRRLTNKTMTEETTRVRSENIREFFQILWEFKMGVDVLSVDNQITYIPNSKLDGILKLGDAGLEKFLLERLMHYNPFVAILDKLIEYKHKKIKFTQKDIAHDFHKTDRSGNLDNVHPLLRWANHLCLVDKERKEITDKGEKFVDSAEKLGICYIHYSFDLKDNVNWNILVHILSNQPRAQNMSFEDIGKYLDRIPDENIKNIDIGKTLTELVNLGVPININHNRKKILIKNKIVHSTTSRFYVKCMLDHVDEISEITPMQDLDDDDEKLLLGDVCEVLIISDEIKINLDNYPNNTKIVSYDQFCKIENLIPSLPLKMIIISSCWKPLKLIDKISGTLLAFARLGGSLVIENINTFGRTGSNTNRYVWLPYDIARISSVPIRDNKDVKGYFTFNKQEKFTFTYKIDQQETKQDSGRYTFLKLRYCKGLIIFITLTNPKKILELIIQDMPKINIDKKDIQWIERGLMNPKKDPTVNNERALYPILREKMNNYFNFCFDPDIEGKSGQTDMMIMNPFTCCCEVSTFAMNVTTSNKVYEVDGHRNGMKRKYRNSGKYYNKEIQALVFGNFFSSEDGADNQGSVNLATATKVTLMSYMDLYELICINDKSKLNETEFKRIFCYNGDQPLTSERIYKLAKEKRVLI